MNIIFDNNESQFILYLNDLNELGRSHIINIVENSRNLDESKLYVYSKNKKDFKRR